jgi:phosphoglycerate dehydrogenase-like enzyme
MNVPEEIFRIHFETRSKKPDVFRFTEDLIASAMARNGYPRDGVPASATLGSDLSDLSWLPDTQTLVTSNEVIVDPRFPRYALADRAPRLKWIHIIGAGIEPLLPLDWLPRHVILTNNSGVHFDKAVESATMVLLMLNSRLPEITANQHRCVWKQIFTSTIRGKTVLVIGVGDMGAAVAAAARSLGLTVLGIRRSGCPHEFVDEMFSIGELDALLSRADFVVLAAPLTNETVNLMDDRRFGLMKRGVGFFNFGRAGSVDHHALMENLNNGHLSGAVIDVVDKEPLDPNSSLWRAKNLTIMPHVSSDDLDLYLPKTFDLVFQNLERLLTNQPLLNAVDRLKQY